MFSRIGVAAYKKDLTNTIELCKSIDNPHHKFKTIHIAGTNGKGSTSHMLAAILQQAGYKTGLYTSPHLKDFRERIKINGIMISEEEVINFINNINAQIESIEPSFFEITVAMAFDYFAKEKVNIAIIETGLGGRLDSTNIINPLVSIITNIGLDHQNLLGNTLAEIAIEKAGIIKQNTPIIIGEILPETEPIFKQKSIENNAPIYFAMDEIIIEKVTDEIDKLNIKLWNKHTNKRNDYELDLSGQFQVKNIKAVLVAVALLNQKGFLINEKSISVALQNVKKHTGLHGRWEIISKNPTVIIDVAHNVDGIKELIKNIGTLYNKNDFFNQLHIVIGMVKDKDVDIVLALLPKNAIYYFTQANVPRALPKEDLQDKANKFNLKGNVFQNVNVALLKAKQNAGVNEDAIIICGSVFLIGEVDFELN
jgi:dihydrofolate synthase / folylpolyglutamate synthase